MKLSIKVIPSSSKNCLAGWLEKTLKIKVMAAPEKGKANKAVIQFLEEKLGLSKGSIIIQSGHKTPKKILEIKGMNEEEVLKKLSEVGKRLFI